MVDNHIRYNGQDLDDESNKKFLETMLEALDLVKQTYRKRGIIAKSLKKTELAIKESLKAIQ